ncbi:ATP-dependent 6-phosphofructokinase 2-like protein [Tanacetum coccineum]
MALYVAQYTFSKKLVVPNFMLQLLAVEMAQHAISAAHVEAESAPNSACLVNLMGRHSGHITLDATLSSCDVDFIVVAEGVGQDIILRNDAHKQKDESRNPDFLDVGPWLKQS